MAINYGIYDPNSAQYKKSKKYTEDLDANRVKDRLIMQQLNSLQGTEVDSFNQIVTKYPTLSRDVALGLIRAGATADTPGIGTITSIDGIAKVMSEATKLKTLPSTINKDTSILGSIRNAAYGSFKAGTRYTFALLRSPYDYATTVGRDALALTRGEMGVSDFIKEVGSPTALFGRTTQLGALVRDQFDGGGVSTGSGFFISPESRVGKQQARAMMEYGRINGNQSYTLGRGFAQLALDPNSTKYKVTSGIVDAVLNVALDPSTWFGAGSLAKGAQVVKATAKGGVKAGKAAYLSGEVGGLVGAAKGGKEATEARGIASQEVIQQWINDVKELPSATKLKRESLAKGEEITRVAKDIFMKADEEFKLAEHSLRAADEFESGIVASNLATAFKNTSPDIDDAKIVNKIKDIVVNNNVDKASDSIYTLQADYKNTMEIFPGAIAVEDLPKAGDFVFGAQRSDEFAIALAGKGDLTTLDLLAGTSRLSKEEKIAEIARREELFGVMERLVRDNSLPVRTRSAIRQVTTKEFIDDALFGDGTGNLAQLLNKVIGTRNKHAIQLVTKAVQDVYKVDAFSNIRAINLRGLPRTGGHLIVNPEKIALKGLELTGAFEGKALEPILATKNAATALAKATAAREEALAKQTKTLRDLEEIRAMRAEIAKDPKLVYQMLNKADDVDLRNIAELEAKIGLKQAWKEGIREEIGLVDSFGGPINLNLDKVNKFLLGKRFNAVAQILAKMENTTQVMRMFNNKIDAEIAVQIAKAETSDDVLRVLRNALGDPTQDINLARSLALRGETLLKTNPLFKTIVPVPQKAIKVMEGAERYFSRYMVRSTIVPLDDLDRLVTTTRQWMETLKIDNKVIDEAIDKLARAEAGTDRNILTVRAQVLDSIMLKGQEALIEKLAPNSPELAEIIKKTVKLAGQDRDIASTYTNALRVNNELPGVIYGKGADGKPLIQQMDGAVFVSQFLDTMARFPDTKAITESINNYLKAESTIGKVRAATAFANEMNDIWRSAMLVGRVSYVLRNVGEMQIRQYLSGHETMFSNPLGYMAIMMGSSEGNAFKKFLSHIEKYKDDALGNKFDDATADKMVSDVMEEFVKSLRNGASSGDIRAVDANIRIFGKVYRSIDSKAPEYHDALASNIARYAVDDIMQLVAKFATTTTGRDDLVKSLVKNKGIKINGESRKDVLRDIYNASRVTRDDVKVSAFDNIFLKDPEKGFSYDNINETGVYNWLFDEKSTGSHMTELSNLMGGGELGVYISKLIADGEVVVPTANGAGITLRVPRYKGLDNPNEYAKLEKDFKAAIAQAFPAEKMPNGRAIYADSKGFLAGKKLQWTRMNDAFFNWASKIEDVANFGPEFRMAFWDNVGKYAPAMSTKDLEDLLPLAFKNLQGIKVPVGNKMVPLGRKHQTLRIIDRELKRRQKFGEPVVSMTREQVNSLAGKMAAKHVSEIFYDATKQNMVANSFRLLVPFGQAHFNTIATWGKLIYKNPVKVYRFGKAFDALTKPGSSAIYDITNTEYDENQGFLYEDEFGTTRFRYPLVGGLFGAFAGLATGNKMPAEALQLTAPVQSLNLALGSTNPGVPGLAPVAGIAYQMSGMSNAFGPTWDLLRNYVFPYGQPEGPLEPLLPSWLNKGFLSFIGNSQLVERGTKDWAGYLASTQRYGDNPFANAEARNQLMSDARSMSGFVAGFNALFQSIAPATPATEVLSRVPDNEGKYKMMTLTSLYQAWREMSNANPGDYNGTVGDFVAKFGIENIMAIVSGSTRAVTGTDDAWTFLNQNPDMAEKYAGGRTDIIPYFFPGGEAATAYYNWQKFTGVRERLNPQELSDAAAELVYNMELSQISEEMAAYGYSQSWYSQKVVALNKRYGGSKPVSSVLIGVQQNRTDAINRALEEPQMKASPVYNEASEFMKSYNAAIEHLQLVRRTPEPDLGGSYWLNVKYRNELKSLGQRLVQQNPQFANMYYLVFANLLKENK